MLCLSDVTVISFFCETTQKCLSGKLLNSILLKSRDLLLAPAVAVMAETLGRHLSTRIALAIPAASSHCALQKYCSRSKSFSLQIALRQIWHRIEWNKCFHLVSRETYKMTTKWQQHTKVVLAITCTFSLWAKKRSYRQKPKVDQHNRKNPLPVLIL